MSVSTFAGPAGIGAVFMTSAVLGNLGAIAGVLTYMVLGARHVGEPSALRVSAEGIRQ